VFDGRSWHPIPGPAPAPRRYAVLGYDPELGGCLLNGGSEDDDGARGFGDTWLFRDGAWTRLASGLDTHTHDDFGLAYHRAAKRLVMFGGLAGPHDVLVRESDGWRSVEGLRLPPRQQCSPLVWDDDLDGLVYHGGEVSHGGAQFDTTWVLRLSRASAPLGTASRSAAPARGREARPLPVALTVRLLGQGVRAGKFPTSCSPREVLGAVDRMLHGLGLCVNKRGTVSGQLRHSHSALCAIPVDGTARKRGGRAEFVIDLSWHGRMTTAAILLSVFLFPVGLVLALVFTWTAQNGVQRIVDEAFGSLADDLAAD